MEALAGMAQWSEHRAANQRVSGLIPRQGTCGVVGPGPWLGVCGGQTIDVVLTRFSPSLSPSPSL